MAEKQLKERISPLFYFFVSYVALIFILGGANENATLANVILETVGVLFFITSLYKLSIAKQQLKSAKIAVWTVFIVILVPVLQLIPLPSGMWTELPFHDRAAAALETLGVMYFGGRLSLAPQLTWASALSMLPSCAIFLTTLSLNKRERDSLVIFLMAFGLANAFLGLLQFSQNSELGAYLYPDMGAGEVTGFFKNRNHFAALMYALIPMATAVAATNLMTKTTRNEGLASEKRLLLFISALASLFIFIVSCVMARSRAGVILLMVALLLISFLPAWSRTGTGATAAGDSILKKALGAFTAFSVLFAMEYGFYRLLERFEADPQQDARLKIAETTFYAAWAAFPYGTGLGTFQKIYAVIEPIRDVMPHFYVNRAHNDYLEFVLESGLIGVVAIIVFAWWYGKCAREAWRMASFDSESDYVARAAIMTIGLLLLHSFVDYPLRTQAIMGLFAICCAQLLSRFSETKSAINSNNTRNNT